MTTLVMVVACTRIEKLKKKEIIIADQTMIATTIVKEIGRILSAGSKGEPLRILGMKGVMTKDVMITMTAEMTVGMIGKGHQGHLSKKNQGLLKDPHLIMT